LNISIYIYIERERERERDLDQERRVLETRQGGEHIDIEVEKKIICIDK